MNVIAITLKAHGTFESTVEHVDEFSKLSKTELARRIAESYGSVEFPQVYWRGYSRTVLAVIAAGIFNATN